MGYITATFLGKNYSIPEDILLYIDLLDFTSSIKTRLTNTFVRKLKGEVQNGKAYIDDRDLAPVIEQQVNLFIAKLTECDIYDRTASDYLRQNEGYKLISKINATAREDSQREYDRQMSDWREGHENAIQKKDASVTGLSFSVISGRFINHAIYAAMEASKINEQEKVAAKEYEKEVAELNARLKSRKAAHVKRYTETIYIPKMEAAITVFSYELLDTFISDLIKYGKLNKEVLNYTHIDRSNDLLKNLEFSQNKAAVLLKAFEVCPYNIAVYMQAMKCDLLDYDSFQTAKVFNQGNTILSFLKDNWGEVSFPNKFNINYYCIALFSLFTNKNQRDLLHSYTEQYVTGIVKAYSRAAVILNRKDIAVKIMSECSDTVLLGGSAISKSKAREYVSGIVSQPIWEELTQKCGYDNLLDSIKTSIGGDRSTTKKELDTALEEKLYRAFEEVRQDLSNKIIEQNRLKAEEQKAKEAELSRIKKRRTIAIIIGIPLAIIAMFLLTLLSDRMEEQQQEREAQQRIENYCTFQLPIQEYSSEKACLLALQKLSFEYSDLKEVIRDDWNSYGSEEDIHEELMLELDKNFTSVAEAIVSNCSVELDFDAKDLVTSFQRSGTWIEYIGELIAERDYAHAFDVYMDSISGKYVEDATHYIIDILYPETFDKGIRERLLEVGVHAWGNTGRELLNSILSYIDSMPEGRAPFESDIATARRQLSEKNAATGK